MKFRNFNFFIYLFLLIFICPIKAYCLESIYFELVNKFKTAVLEGDKNEIAKFIIFPLSRSYPIPNIDTPEDFIKRFEDIFDDKLIRLINISDIHEHWGAMGWRGIMLHNGDLWMDYDGKIIGINYQSETEKALKNKIIAASKKKLHKSIKEFSEPVLDWRTKTLRIRIDKIDTYKYRYVSWPTDKPSNTEPDLVLDNGECIPEGNGGNEYYKFNLGNYTYKVYVFVIGVDIPGRVDILKNNKLLFSEDFIEAMSQ